MSQFPVFELLTYLSIKYQEYFEYIEEQKLAEQISCWFYTQLLLPSRSKSSAIEDTKWKKIFTDEDIKSWYYKFVGESIKFYEDRFTTIKKLGKK
jgi:hypothetical protein